MTGSTGIVSTFAGDGSTSSAGDGGLATAASIYYPDCLFLASTSALYVTEISGNKIRKIFAVTPTIAPSSPPTSRPSSTRSLYNSVTSAVGNGISNVTASGSLATATAIKYPRGVWQDSTGYVYYTESGNNCVRKFDINVGIVISVIGVCGSANGYTADGSVASSAVITYPVDVLLTTAGTVYYSENHSCRIRKVVTGLVYTLAGTGSGTDSGNGGPATSAGISGPQGMFLDSAGQLYFAVYGASTVRKLDATGQTIWLVTGRFLRSSLSNIYLILPGTGTGGFSGDGGSATSAMVNRPERVTADTLGTLFIGDGSKCGSLLFHFLSR